MQTQKANKTAKLKVRKNQPSDKKSLDMEFEIELSKMRNINTAFLNLTHELQQITNKTIKP